MALNIQRSSIVFVIQKHKVCKETAAWGKLLKKGGRNLPAEHTFCTRQENKWKERQRSEMQRKEKKRKEKSSPFVCVFSVFIAFTAFTTFI